MSRNFVAIKPQPACGHRWLRDCPLTAADWAEVFNAWLAFRFQCVLISEQAHARTASQAGGRVNESSES